MYEYPGVYPDCLCRNMKIPISISADAHDIIFMNSSKSVQSIDCKATIYKQQSPRKVNTWPLIRLKDIILALNLLVNHVKTRFMSTTGTEALSNMVSYLPAFRNIYIYIYISRRKATHSITSPVAGKMLCLNIQYVIQCQIKTILTGALYIISTK